MIGIIGWIKLAQNVVPVGFIINFRVISLQEAFYSSKLTIYFLWKAVGMATGYGLDGL